MPLSYDEAIAAVTAAGQRYEVAPLDLDGVTTTAFVNAPPSLRDLFDSARLRGDTTFLVYEDERWSCADVMAQVDGLGAALVETYGIAKGDRVAIAMRNYPEWVMSYAAIISVGAVAVSFNAWWVTDEISYALDDAGISVVIADAERVERAVEPCRERSIPLIGVRVPDASDGVDRWADVVRIGPTMPSVVIHPDDDATILYTSGTTGFPKGAVSTHRAILQALMGFGCRSAVEIARGRDEAPSADSGMPVFILIVPLFHVTGCVPVMLTCFASGLKLVMMHRWEPVRALQLIEREGVTNFVGVPTQSWDLLESPEFERYDTSTLTRIGGGGAPAPPKLVGRVDDSFSKGRPNIGYGMTETNAYGPQNSGVDYVEHPTSTGRATPILEIEIRDGDDQPVPGGELGEIWFKGPHLIRGYWNKPDATAETIVDGWLRSGDIGRIDHDGFVYVEDRAKDMILRGGENVYSAEVEAVIYDHPAVYEAAVFGVPDERLGEQVAVTVCVRAGHEIDIGDLQAHVAEHLASFKVPTIVDVVSEPLPRNASGKILKSQLRDAATDA